MSRGGREARAYGGEVGGSLDGHVGDGERDEVLLALAELVRRAGEVAEATRRIALRAAEIEEGRRAGRSYREIVDAAGHPLIAELLTETISAFEAAGTRFRAAEARALQREGMTLEQIAQLFGVSRQRISTLLRTDPFTPASG